MKFKGVVLGLLLLLLVPTGARATHEALTLDALGIRVCEGFGGYCATTWTIVLANGAAFNALIYHVCVLVRNEEGLHMGMKCAERAIEETSHLISSETMRGQFEKGERELHPKWHRLPDAVWASLIKRSIVRIPAYCDQKTPEIFEYFPCLVDSVAGLPDYLK